MENIQFTAVGDVMLSRCVGELITDKGPNFPFLHVKEILNDSDFTFCNVECPLSDRGKSSPKQPPHVTFRANPIVATGLKNSGFNIVSIANNHIVDYGNEGLILDDQVFEETINKKE